MSRVRLPALLAAAALALTACGGSGHGADSSATGASSVPLSQLDVVDDPRAVQGPSTATLADADIEPVADSPDQELPVTVTSHERGGATKVEVTDTSRVVAMDLSGSIAATVHGLGLGDTLVGRDQSTTFPGAKDLPLVTSGGHSVNAEALLALEPTLVITDGSIGPRDVVEQLTDAGVTVVFVDNDPSFEGAAQLATDVAEVLGVPDAGTELSQQITSQIADVEREITRLAPTAKGEKVRMLFLYIRGNSGVYYLFGKESGADDLIEGLGGVDVASEQGWKGQQPMTDEAITSADPDLVLVMTSGLESAGGIDQLLQDKPALALTKAGQHRRFVDMADGDVLSFGPRSAGVLEALARAVYAPEATS